MTRSDRRVARDERGRPYLLCPECRNRIEGANQQPKICPDCLQQWLVEVGLPLMKYAMEDGGLEDD